MSCDKFKIKPTKKCKTEQELFKDRDKYTKSIMPMIIQNLLEMNEIEKAKNEIENNLVPLSHDNRSSNNILSLFHSTKYR